MQSKFSRRDIVKGSLIAGALMPFVRMGTAEAAAALPALDPADPTAKALGFRAGCQQGGCSGKPDLQAVAEMRNLCAISGKGGRCERSL